MNICTFQNIRPAVRSLSAGLALSALAAPAAAKDEPSNQYLEALKVCQSEQVDAQRLLCYDKAVQTMVAATEDGDLRVVDRGEVRETRRKLFGFTLPEIGIFKKGDKTDDELDSLQTTIASVQRAPRGGWFITTQEGAKWMLTDVPRRLLDPRAGQPVEFKKAALGSFFISINHQLGVKGRRVQ